MPDHLERVVHIHEPDSCTCGQCGASLVKIGEDVTEQLDVVPAKFFVHRHIRPQYACRPCETIEAAPIPPAIIDGSMATPGVFAWLIVSKFVDHLPLYRLERIAARDGLVLSRSTLASWVGYIGVALEPLYWRLINHVLNGATLHADETPVAQLDPGRGKTKRAYFWTYRSNVFGPDPPIVVFDYRLGRSGQFATEFLGSGRGALMVDDYAGYKELFRRGIIELACWAHARRKFFELHQAHACPVSAEALRRIAALYAIEARASELSVEQRAAVRHAEAKPRLDAFHAWLLERRSRVANGGALAKAIDYSLRRWEALARYAERGDWPIDNNPMENAIRSSAVGKKNWLFIGSEAAGKRAAIFYSLLETARINGIDPMAWLKDTLEKLPSWPNNRIDERLPIVAR